MAALAAPAPGAAAANARAKGSDSVLLAFLPSYGGTRSAYGGARAAYGGARSPVARMSSPDGRIEGELVSVKGLSVGIMSATQGAYTTAQLLLDITQGTRIASSAYAHASPPALSLQPAAAGAVVRGWPAARKRAADAPQLMRPGLLAAQIPGGAGYAGVAGVDDLDGVVAADSHGNIPAVSLGTAQTLLARVAALHSSKRFIVCDLPGGAEGEADLHALSQGRTAGELLILVQRAPDTPGHELLWAAIAGLAGGGGKELSSGTTNERGLISAIDLAPTILTHLRVRPIPADMRGEPIETDGSLHTESLRSLMTRLRVIGGRRLKALACLLGAWALLLLCSTMAPRGGRGARRAWAMRAGALGVLWAPVAALIGAALEPSASVEYATITLACLALGALTDMLLPWPRAPLAPVIVVIVALVLDAFAGTQLLMRSLLGPNPILGARFYGVGNELKPGLAVLAFAAVAAALYPVTGANGEPQRRRQGRAAIAMACAGVLLAAVEGSARIGAGVGGVILVSAGTAIATAILLPGRVSRKRALIILASPAAGLVALAALDLATAHGSGHFTASVLHARSAGDLRDIIVRRYTAAWQELKNHAMPAATALALLCATLAVGQRRRLFAPVASDTAWLAALAGGLTAGVVGALTEDSGPVLLVVAVFTLGCVATYLWGRPLRASPESAVAGEKPAAAAGPGH